MAIEHNYLVNGNFNQAITPFDRGFAYGDGVFRTMRIKSCVPVDWPQHYQKLVADCAAIGIVCPSAELLMNDLQQFFNPDENSVAKIIITRGEGERGYATPAITTPMRVIVKFAMRQYIEEYYSKGVRLHLCETRLSKQPKLAGIKHLNRLENVMARMEWRDDSIFDGLLLDDQANVIECTMSNVFARFKNHIITPNLSQCGVSGITRQQIINVAKVLKSTIEVTTLPLHQLLEADEVIVCNSLYGAFQVRQIVDKTWLPQSLATNIRKSLKHD